MISMKKKCIPQIFFDASSVWYYFLISKDGKCAKCKRCCAVLKTLDVSTKGLHTHLSAKHG